ncbi:MAG: hypothetical protein ABEJ31_15405 [Haloarculaceae archaeon]
MSALQRALEQRVTNPLLRRLLHSPLHWLASRWLVLVSYEGPRSGRRYTFPVAYHRRDGAVVAVTPATESNWWRTFRQPYPARVWLRGRRYETTGERVTGEAAERLLSEYFGTHSLLARLLGFPRDLAAAPAERDRAMRELAVVRFELSTD